MILIIQNCAIQDIQHVLHLQVNFPKLAKTKLIYKNFQPIAIFRCCCLGFGDGEEYPFEEDHGTNTNGTIAEGKI